MIGLSEKGRSRFGATRTRLRVAQVVCTESFAGVERYVTVLSAALSRAGQDVLVLGGDETAMRAGLEGSGAAWSPAPTVASAIRQLRTHSPFDLVHAHMTQAETAAVIATAGSGVPVVCTRHFAQQRGSSTLRRAASSILARRIDTQISISRFVSDRIEGSSVVIVPGVSGVGTPQPSSKRRKEVLMVQRLEPEKRADLGVEAWSASGLAERGWSLVVAGEGSQLASLATLAASLGVSGSCRFLGFRSDVAELLRNAGIFLAPRPDEPLGLSVIEAMASGTPVVAAAGGGHLETVGLHNAAALYEPYDTVGAGRLLAELAIDASRRDAYGAELAELQKRHLAVDSQLAATVDLYAQILDKAQ